MVQLEVRPPHPHPAAPTVRRLGSAVRRLRGLWIVLLVTAVAVPLGRLVPLVGGPVFGILLGVIAGSVIPALRSEVWRPGYDFASKTLLQLSIVVLGTGLSLQQVARVGVSSLPVMLGTLALALGGAWLFGRILGVRGDTQILIGVGTAICGGSAIAAATAAIGAKRSSVAYALATIFTFNIVAVLTFPPLGHLIGMSSEAFGLWAGTAVNDTSSVVAAGYAYSQAAGDQAIVVKLTRSLTLIPIVLTLVALKIRRENRVARALDAAAEGSYAGATASIRKPLPWRKLVPLFLIGFIAAAGLRSAGAVPSSWLPTLTIVGSTLITAALAAIGLSLRPRELRDAGPRPLLLGAILWVLVAVGSLGLQSFS
ncbi:putative integral membrane protein (TIGR00698 family) [Kribbella sp. VKM Ac-2571]|nr:putative integral membrane protein (TIGR00698 family) [Kribbella sp. VKM Ac-2571]